MENRLVSSGLIDILCILKPYLSQIVIGGGWVPHLYNRYLQNDSKMEPLFTRDIDLLVQKNLPVIGKKTVDHLLTETGMITIFKSRSTPPLILYQGNIGGHEVEVEFLTHQEGSNPAAVIEVQQGLHAEALRYLSVLLENTITLEINELGSQLIVKVPTPAAYIFNKGLTFTRRKEKIKKAKDLYYIFDMLSSIPSIKDEIMNGLLFFENKYPKWFKTFKKNLTAAFHDIYSDGVLWTISQCSAGVYINLDDDQLKQYIYGIFSKLLNELP